MAIEKNDYNTLNNIQIGTENNKTYTADIRNVVFFTRDFDIEPTFITTPTDLKDLGISGLVNSEFYQLVASAYTQKFDPIGVIVYGKTGTTDFSDFYEAYEESATAFEAFNWVTAIDIPTEADYLDSVVKYAKISKDFQFYIALKYDQFTDISDLLKVQKESNLDNLAYFVEGKNNLDKGNWVTGAFVGGTVGYKTLGKWQGQATHITKFLQENWTKTEQKTMFDAGFNYLSKPTRGYFHLVNGINSDNSTFIELKLAEIWLRNKLKEEITILQVTKDKISNDDNGRALLSATINEVCRIGANNGIFRTADGDWFGTISEKDELGNQVQIKLGYLTVDSITQEQLRTGILNFKLKLTFLGGVRFVNLTGVIDTDGELVYE